MPYGRIRPIVTNDHPSLRTVAAEVKGVDADVRSLMDDLVYTMQRAGGVGLASTQVNSQLRVIAVSCHGRSAAYANPRIVSSSGRTHTLEGCLSLPGVMRSPARHGRIEVEALDRSGAKVEIAAKGFQAVVFQHELDHLDGILIIDRVAPWKLSPRLRKLRQPLEQPRRQAVVS